MKDNDEMSKQLPTPKMASEYLTRDQIDKFEALANDLKEAFGPTPTEFYVAGWLWIQTAKAQRMNVNSFELTLMLDNAYREVVLGEDPEKYL